MRSASTSSRIRTTTSTTCRSTARPTTSRSVSRTARTPLVEDPEAIRERTEWVEGQLGVTEFETVYLTTNTETFYLPYGKYVEKLEALAEAADLAEVKAA